MCLLLGRLQACFGTVASLGVAEDTDKWGVSAACCPVLHGAALDLLPASWQEQTDMQQVCMNVTQQLCHPGRCNCTGHPRNRPCFQLQQSDSLRC
jgi:hypothetical protein